jgi:N2-(2-carboxyethyl)arginine synthase
MVRGSVLFLEAAKRHGVRHAFGIVGGEADQILFDEVDGIDFLLTRHETTASVMADAYARLTGRPQIAYSTFGPGMTNLLTGIACAALERTPMLAVSAQVARDDIAYGQTHQCLDTVSIARSMVKFAHELTSVEEIPAVVAEAMRCSRAIAEGPSFLSFPRDLMGEKIDARTAERLLDAMPDSTPVAPVAAPATDVRALAEKLAQAEHPVVIVGNLVARQHAEKELRAFVERFSLPTVTSLASKGVLPDSHPLATGPVNKYLDGILEAPVLDRIFASSDLVLLVGFDYAEDVKPEMWRRGRPKEEILLGPVPNTIEHIFRPTREVVGGLGPTLRALAEAGPRRFSSPTDIAIVSSLKLQKAASGADGRGLVSPQNAVRALRRALGPDGILCSDIGLHKQIAGLFTDTERPNTFLCSNGLGSFGTGLGLALGAKVACPDRRVGAIVGDGGFHSNSQDLETAARCGIPFVVVVFKDNAYGLIKYYQLKGRHRLAPADVEFGSVDFVGLARANGWEAQRIESDGAVDTALDAAFEADRPTLLEVPVEYEALIEALRRPIAAAARPVKPAHHDSVLLSAAK